MQAGGHFELTIIDERPGLLSFKAKGENVKDVFSNEAGGHRFQRVPPTEKKGRVHTSTITVAVLEEPSDVQVSIKDKDLDWKTTRGSGAGGQHRNTTESAVQLTHVPTGITVRCESERSQQRNKEMAMQLLRAKIWQAKKEEHDRQRSSNRRNQVGSGMRGDKIRTIRYQDGIVIDHINGQKWNLRDYLKGKW